MVTDNLPSLDAFNAAVQLIQGDEAFAGAYLPISTALQRRLASLASSTSQILSVELSDCEDRHLDKCPAEGLPADHEGKRFKTEVELLELCTLIIPQYRAGTWDAPSDEDLAQRIARFQTFCWVELKKAEGVDEDAPAPFSNQVAVVRPKRKRSVRGEAELLSELGQIAGGPQPALPPDAQGEGAGGQMQALTMKQYLGAQFRAYQSDAFVQDGQGFAAFWRKCFADGKYLLLRPAVKYLMKYTTGTSFLERVFSYAEQVCSDKLRKEYDLRRHMFLRVNGHPLGIKLFLPFNSKREQQPEDT